MDYSFGQNDLMNYGKYAIENNIKLQTINTGRHYSLNYYGPKDVVFSKCADEEVQGIINSGDKDTLFIMRNKHLKKAKGLKFKPVMVGTKYTLLKK